ncbi:hypothetical protein LINGRAHAP2_LOCUS30094 [Linum grandiflorum]
MGSTTETTDSLFQYGGCK